MFFLPEFCVCVGSRNAFKSSKRDSFSTSGINTGTPTISSSLGLSISVQSQSGTGIKIKEKKYKEIILV